MTQYIVWVGGMEIGTYNHDYEATEVAGDWTLEGYKDVQIEVNEVDNETPAQVNAWLLSGGW